MQYRYENLKKKEQKMFYDFDIINKLTVKVRIANKWYRKD